MTDLVDLIARVEGAPDAKFWSDDFDMDLLKVLPIAEADANFLRSVELWTHGHTTHDRLNHPTVWNGDIGSLAFFGSRPGNSGKPAVYWTNSQMVSCTGLEAFRDAWAHSYVMLLDGEHVIWDTGKLWPQFEAIMWNIRGWPGRTDAQKDAAVKASMRSFGKAVALLRSLQAGAQN